MSYLCCLGQGKERKLEFDTAAEKTILLLMDEMRFAGAPPDVVTYNILLKFYAPPYPAELKEEKIVETIKTMKVLGLKPNATTFNTIIQSYCQRGNLSRAQLYLKEMRVLTCY